MKAHWVIFIGLCWLLCGPQVVAAADETSLRSEGQIEFVPSTEITDPTDPTDPGNPIDPIDPINPEEPPGSGTGGPLSIDFASTFYFGQQTITSQDRTYMAQPQRYRVDGVEKVGPNFVQVTDNRGSAAGWKVVVKQADQFHTDQQVELAGAVLQLTNGRVVSASSAPPPAGTSQLRLTPGVEALILDARVGSGAGTFLLDWGHDETSAGQSIHLTVPGASAKYAEKYQTTFIWSLSTTPENQ